MFVRQILEDYLPRAWARDHRLAAGLLCEQPEREDYDTIVFDSGGKYHIKGVPDSDSSDKEPGILSMMKAEEISNLKVEANFRLDSPINRTYISRIILDQFLFFKL